MGHHSASPLICVVPCHDLALDLLEMGKEIGHVCSPRGGAAGGNARIPGCNPGLCALEARAGRRAPPSYAVIEPESSDLNIDSVVLACEEAGDARVLQLQIYLSTEGPLMLKGATPQQLKDDPRAEIVIDGRVFPVALLFYLHGAG